MTWRGITVAAVLTAGIAVQAQVVRRGAVPRLADEKARREAMVLYSSGADALAAERFQEAVDAFSQAVQKDPLFALAYYSMGHGYMLMEEYEPAIQAYRRSIEASRGLFDLQEAHDFEVEQQRNDEILELREVIRRGGRAPTIMALEQHLHDLENQKPSLDTTFKPAPEVLLSLGSALLRAGRPDEAVQAWETAVEVNPNLGAAHNNLAVVYMQAGRYDAAQQEIEAAERSGLRVNPQFKEDLNRRREAQ